MVPSYSVYQAFPAPSSSSNGSIEMSKEKKGHLDSSIKISLVFFLLLLSPPNPSSVESIVRRMSFSSLSVSPWKKSDFPPPCDSFFLSDESPSIMRARREGKGRKNGRAHPGKKVSHKPRKRGLEMEKRLAAMPRHSSTPSQRERARRQRMPRALSKWHTSQFAATCTSVLKAL